MASTTSRPTVPRPIGAIRTPVRLELNSAGAWKVVLTFDGNDAEVLRRVQEVAHGMGVLSAELGGRQSWRLYRPLKRQVLMYWSVERGWEDVPC